MWYMNKRERNVIHRAKATPGHWKEYGREEKEAVELKRGGNPGQWARGINVLHKLRKKRKYVFEDKEKYAQEPLFTMNNVQTRNGKR